MDTTNNLGEVVLVKDINPGAADSYNLPPDRPRYFFRPDLQVESNEELNSPADDQADTSVPPASPPASSSPGNFLEFNDKLYFSAYDREKGSELFVSDGTAEGTKLVADIDTRPGVDQTGFKYGSSPSQLTEVNDKFYFVANDGESGQELFVSDGTGSGTQLLVDLNPGEDKYGSANSSFPSYLVELNGKLYFRATDGVNGDELFVSDGTAEGTKLVADIYPGEDQYGFGNGSGIIGLIEFKDKLYFRATDGESGYELFVSDGTAEGTELVVDIYPGEDQYGPLSSDPSNFVELDDKLYFTANTAENNNGLYVSDGTAEGTKLVADLGSSYSSYLTEFNGKLYFSANDDVHGNELYVSDGTTKGTGLLADLNSGVNDFGYNNSSFPRDFVEFNDQLYFVATDRVHGTELFVTDGTTEGTQLVADIYPGEDKYGYGYSSRPSGLTVFGNELFFSANNGETGSELYKLTLGDSTEGTPVLMNESEDDSDNLLDAYGSEQVQASSEHDSLDCLS